MMQTATFTLTFTTPAFLGDANQNARWRTPPIKHELRHWWRVAYAADHGFRVNVSEMRREEGLLFGHAWLENDAFVQDGRKTKTAARQSQVRIRLDHWNEGMLRQWPQDTTVTHPSVRMPIGSTLYLGYGPLTFNRNSSKTALKANAAIQEQEQATLAIAYPEATASLLEQALWLMDRFGTLGGRARNGWGSYHLLPSPSRRGNGGEDLPLRDWRECLKLDWPHAIGKDETGPLIWQTEPHEDWKSLMRTLAIVKIGLRTQFRFALLEANGDKQLRDKREQPAGISHGKPQDRHWLAYPVTHHSVAPWDKERVNNKTVPLNLRLPNQLRFKVRQTADDKLVGVIFHMPHLPPPAFKPDREAIEKVWRCVHQFLDELSKAPKVRDFCPRADRTALQKQAQ
ncbi:MAG: RAMP superfamily CRISPR-associated protein [Hydrogenophilus sp.]